VRGCGGLQLNGSFFANFRFSLAACFPRRGAFPLTERRQPARKKRGEETFALKQKCHERLALHCLGEVLKVTGKTKSKKGKEYLEEVADIEVPKKKKVTLRRDRKNSDWKYFPEEFC
jgi:hypothetical protein